MKNKRTSNIVTTSASTEHALTEFLAAAFGDPGRIDSATFASVQRDASAASDRQLLSMN